MKKNIILLALFLIPYLSSAQNAFDKFDGQDNVSSVVVNKKMFELMSKVKMESKEDQAYLNLIKKLDNLKVYKTSSTRVSADMRGTVDKYLSSANLEELMRVNENGKNAKIYVKSSGGNNVHELLMFIEGSGAKGNESILMSLTGDFDLNEISLLTKKMNLPGGEELNKASKK
ncbi:MAG: DUF4252 domain-containing protein [Limnohabitans sp.]|nr:DUF4252 domain-containing protein [Limnohabitans sp.]